MSRCSSDSSTTLDCDEVDTYANNERCLNDAEYGNVLDRLRRLTVDLARYPPRPLGQATVERAVRSCIETEGCFLDLCDVILPELAFTVLPLLLAKIPNYIERHKMALVAHKALEMMDKEDAMKGNALSRWGSSLQKGLSERLGARQSNRPC